ADNFSGQTGTPAVDLDRFRSDLSLYRADMGVANRELAIVNHSANRHAVELVELFESLAPARTPVGAPLREMGRLVRLQWQTEERAFGLAGEARVVREELQRVPKLAATSSAPRDDPGPTVLEDGAVVCAGAIVFAGARICAGAIVGDQAHVRERTVLGPDSVLGRGSALGSDVRIGARARIQTNVWLTSFTVVEDDVFVGPGVVTTNDDEMGRGRPPVRPGLRVDAGKGRRQVRVPDCRRPGDELAGARDGQGRFLYP